MWEEIGGFKGLGVIFTILTTMIGAIVGYTRLRSKVESNAKDTSKNDERLRKEISEQNVRNEKRFDDIEAEAKLLRRDQAESKDKLIRMESDVSHTKDVVDSMQLDLKKIVEQVTIVATKIEQKQ